MHRFCCEQEAAENLLAVLGVTASGEAAQVTAQMFEPAFAQVGRTQPMAPVCRESEEGQHAFQLVLEFLHHLRWQPPPARETVAPSPAPALGFPRPRSTRTLAGTCVAGTTEIAASVLPSRGTNAPGSVDAGPPALFAFPLPSLAHAPWQNRWFKSGPRNQDFISFQQHPRTPQPSEFSNS
jgi:hypothetical protein